jgi:phospholipid/cholesterol/gamma-HCH transport system ATP-binding protein
MSALVEFNGVHKAFGDHVVFDELSLSIEKGESLAIVGGSGCGKSVLLRTLIGLTEFDRGSVRFDGQELSELDDIGFLNVRKRVSMMFQGGALFDSLSVGDNVAYPLRSQLTLSEQEIQQRVAE